MSATKRVGLLGGTFDPIHIGHLAAAEDAAFLLSLDQVLFIPNRVPPHKVGDITPVEHRLAMLELAIETDPLFSVSLVEVERAGPSYTVDTLRVLQKNLGRDAELFFLTGCDSITQLHTWHEPDRLLADFHVVVLDRPSPAAIDWKHIEQRFPKLRAQVTILHVVQLDISSTEIRRRIAQGRPIRYYVPPAIESYIRTHDLYAVATAKERTL